MNRIRDTIQNHVDDCDAKIKVVRKEQLIDIEMWILSYTIDQSNHQITFTNRFLNVYIKFFL